MRIFVAMPAMVGEDMIGVVYVNRTPNDIFRSLYCERFEPVEGRPVHPAVHRTDRLRLLRFMTRPIRALIARMDATGGGAALSDGPEQYGTREIETLGLASAPSPNACTNSARLCGFIPPM